MLNLEELFTLGNVSRVVDVKNKDGVTIPFRISLLDTANLQKAINAAANTQSDDVAYAMELKKQIIARSLTSLGGQQLFQDEKNPKPEELKTNLDLLNNNHFSLVNRLYKEYEELDGETTKEVDDEIKK